MFWVISVYFNIRNTLPKSGTFLLGHPLYKHTNYRKDAGLRKSATVVLTVSIDQDLHKRDDRT